ncbi:aldo-keto reductase family 1 member B1-like [Glossina fuscipes]|uniref:Aldo-keto reductase family 1 member B1-like n=1 Tax=Glossina fuscipes TaxID=7396 RepID=A0A9C5ZG61_9MUSC|nr:aldo-keto reductase family 1 member B1-like [Glossina fuscipes]
MVAMCGPRRAGQARTVELNNGMEIPFLGLGTWGSVGDQGTEAVVNAVEVGYRLIDCAPIYQNESCIGSGIKSILENKVVKREELFIISKLWNTFHRPDLVEEGICMSLNDLRLDYLDSYLMHWPMAYHEGETLIPRDACGKIKYSSVDYIDTWKAMENLVKLGLTKSIGLSNFNKEQIQRILDISTVRPVILQIECHPYLTQHKMIDYCRKNKIVVISYSPLGAPARPWALRGEQRLLDDKMLEKLSVKYNKTPAQILIRYQIQRGNVVIPKSVTKARIISNFDVFEWSLEEKDVKDLDRMLSITRMCEPRYAGGSALGELCSAYEKLHSGQASIEIKEMSTY